MQTVSELNKDDSDIVCQGDEHLTDVRRLDVLLRIVDNVVEAQVELCNAINETAYDRSELLRDHCIVNDRILDRVVKECSNDGINVDLEVSQDHGDCNRVRDIRLARLTLLVTVCLECENKSLLELLIILLDIFLIEIRSLGIIVVKLRYLVEFLFEILRDFRPDTVVLKISALGFRLHYLFSYGIKCLVILGLTHLVFSYRPQNH